MEKEVNTYGQFNFQIALEKIETLTQQNNELLDIVDKLEEQLHHQDSHIHGFEESQSNKSRRISDDADAAMKRFTTKLRRELNKNGKSKQSKGQPV